MTQWGILLKGDLNKYKGQSGKKQETEWKSRENEEQNKEKAKLAK